MTFSGKVVDHCLPFAKFKYFYLKKRFLYLYQDNKYSSIGPIYYEYGSMVLTYQNFDDAIQACYILKDATYEERSLSGTNKNLFIAI